MGHSNQLLQKHHNNSIQPIIKIQKRKISKMKGTMSMVLLGCMVFICLGSEFYDEKSNNRLDDIEQNVETRNAVPVEETPAPNVEARAADEIVLALLEACVDIDDKCDEFKTYCGKNTHVTERCPKTCEQCTPADESPAPIIEAIAPATTPCEDISDNCKGFTKYCGLNPHVDKKCQKSCGHCRPCEDISTRCDEFAKYCGKNSYVTNRCLKTCRVCICSLGRTACPIIYPGIPNLNKDTTCIDSCKRCDGREDCPGGTDECGCCSSDQFDCTRDMATYGNMTNFHPQSCISFSKRCDDVKDCPNGSDEANCPAGCQPKDSDACLQASPGWSTYVCSSSSSIGYCTSWGKDMRRCCPESCATGIFTEQACNQFPGQGTCTYPNEAQCPVDEIGWKEFADNWYKFRANEISAMEFAQKQYSPEIEIYINTGRCDVDGKFFGLKQARILSQKLKENLSPHPFHPVGFQRCSAQETCDYRNTFETVRGERVVVKVGLSETDLKVALITINLEGADTMAAKFIEFNKGMIDSQTFVNTFFSKDVVLNAEDANGVVRILNFEGIPAQLDDIQNPNFRALDVTNRRQCYDRSGDCDFELTYELAHGTIIFWGSLNPAQNKIKRGTIRRMKSLYQ